MLRIHFGDVNNKAFGIEAYFRSQYHSSMLWGNDPFVQKILLEVDKCKHIIDDIFSHPVLGTRTIGQMSGGSKNLILMYKKPQYIMYRGTNCGENCIKLIEEIASIHDFEMSLAYLMKLNPSNITGGIYCINEDRFLKDKEDFLHTYLRHYRDDVGFGE